MKLFSEARVSYVIRQLERDMIDMATEGQFTVGEIQNVFAGWLKQLEVSPAAHLTEPDESKDKSNG